MRARTNNPNNKPIIACLVVLICLTLSLPLFASNSDVQTPEERALAKAFSAYMDGNDKMSLSYFEEVVRINSKNQAAQKGLEKVKIRLKKSSDVERAKAKRLAESKMKEGRQLLRTKDIVAAIDSFHAAQDAVPHYRPAERQLKKIRAAMNTVLKRQQFNLTAWAFARGVMAYLERDWSKAYRIWSERHLVEPDNVPLSNAKLRAENNFKKMMITEQEEFYRRSARAFYEQGYYLQSKGSWDKVLVLRSDDLEALEGKARSEEAYLTVTGKGRNSAAHDLLERGLEFFATQDWEKALEMFKQLAQVDPNLSTANDYIAKINQNIASSKIRPASSGGQSTWKPNKPSAQEGTDVVKVPVGSENFVERRHELESQLKRDPSSIRIQQELDKVLKAQEEESERIYKDGLIAYSQGNRDLAIDKWKQVLIINPDHKKAEAALRKARAEEERSTKESQ